MRLFVFVVAFFLCVVSVEATQGHNFSSAVMVNGDGLPYYSPSYRGPDGGLFPVPNANVVAQPVYNAARKEFSLPIPTGRDVWQFVQTAMIAAMIFFLRRWCIRKEAEWEAEWEDG